MAGVNPDSLAFALECLTQGTELEGARLAVERVPLTVDCDGCGRRTPVEDYVFRCAACGADTVRIATGREMRFVSIDTDDPVEESARAPD
jgi:hydrogenase nickel incorporation protein HypA/HybF